MNYYILGWTTQGNLILMTRKVFPTLDEANAYATQCAAAWRAFVVTEVV